VHLAHQSSDFLVIFPGTRKYPKQYQKYIDIDIYFFGGLRRVTRVPAGNENLGPGSATGTQDNHYPDPFDFELPIEEKWRFTKSSLNVMLSFLH